MKIIYFQTMQKLVYEYFTRCDLTASELVFVRCLVWVTVFIPETVSL